MGLDISVIRTGQNINLERLYTVMHAVVDGMDWYLGDDKAQRHVQYMKLKERALSLSRDDVLNANIPDSTKKVLAGMNKFEFANNLSWVVGSISDFVDESNTHLEFDWDLLPGMSVLDSCSWNLLYIFNRCSKSSGKTPDENHIVELDPRKIDMELARWERKKWKMRLAKVVGWFLPESGSRIAIECACDLGLEDEFVEARDLFYYKGEIEKVVKFMNESYNRLWLVSSY